MKTEIDFQIAKCGMNCNLCYAFLRTKNKCVGCKNITSTKFKSIMNCKIRNCDRVENQHEFCSDCEQFPCISVKNIDKRYKKKYGMSMIQNLENIKNKGFETFCIEQEQKWTCSVCGSLLSVHKPNCTVCDSKNVYFNIPL